MESAELDRLKYVDNILVEVSSVIQGYMYSMSPDSQSDQNDYNKLFHAYEGIESTRKALTEDPPKDTRRSCRVRAKFVPFAYHGCHKNDCLGAKRCMFVHNSEWCEFNLPCPGPTCKLLHEYDDCPLGVDCEEPRCRFAKSNNGNRPRSRSRSRSRSSSRDRDSRRPSSRYRNGPKTHSRNRR